MSFPAAVLGNERRNELSVASIAGVRLLLLSCMWDHAPGEPASSFLSPEHVLGPGLDRSQKRRLCIASQSLRQTHHCCRNVFGLSEVTGARL